MSFLLSARFVCINIHQDIAQAIITQHIHHILLQTNPVCVRHWYLIQNNDEMTPNTMS